MSSPKPSPGNSAEKPNTNKKSQFKATEKWCELIAAFRNGMPCGKHWYMFQFIDDSFSGTEAVDWMYSYLKSCPEFNKVNKENALQLLQKFLDAGILEEIKKSKGRFEYSSRLYKMAGGSPSKQSKTNNSKQIKNPLGLSNDGYQSDSELRSALMANSNRKIGKKLEVIQRPITEEDVNMQWKMALVCRFEDIFGRGTVSSLINVKSLSGANVFFNATHTAANGMLTDVSPQSDLPEWVVSSLSFLSKWSDDVGANLPHYPGVEVDLLRVIVQSFENIPEPMIPCVFHKLALSSVFPELLVNNLPCFKQQFNPMQAMPKNNVRFESIENLLSDMASVSLVGCPSPLLPTAGGHSHRASRSQSMSHGGAHMRSQSSNRYNIRLETAFVGPNNETYTTFKFEETQPSPSVTRRQLLNSSAHCNDSNAPTANGNQQSQQRCHSVQNLVWQPMPANPHNTSSFDRASASFACSNMRPFGSNLENISTIKNADSTTSLPVAVDAANCDNKPQINTGKSSRVDPVSSIQMTLLFMPPPERRRLQMFLRLLSRLLENKMICQRIAPPNGDLRSVLVTMFAPIFVRPKPEEESSQIYNKMAIERLSALLLDKHAAIFAIPDWLSGDVSGRLDRLRLLRRETAAANGENASPVSSPMSPGTPSPRSVPSFCERISLREFKRQCSLNPRGEDENEGASPTHDSLIDLLDSIINNKELTKRERSKKLKEFEKVYPDLFKEYYTNSEFEDNISNKENGGSLSNNNSPLSDFGAKIGGAPWMPRIKEPMLLKKIRARFGNE